jgi:ferredoxin/flavodoxin---NADP+ reductase
VSPKPGTESRPLHVAVVGAGPAGLYTAEALSRREDLCVRVDVFDRWPTPYGLVREGVAPDHQSIKAVVRVLERVLEDPRVRFFGNVSFGEDVSRADLQRLYDQIVYAVGAQTDRRMGIPGEDLAGSWPATDFVRWYNGHPERADFAFDLSAERAVVVGNGNVAVDVARILVTDPDVLAKTDIADHALEALRGSRIREVAMLGRRGPAQAKFTNTELKELGRIEGVDVRVDPTDLALDPDSAASAAADRRVTRNLEILSEFAQRAPTGAGRRIVFRFLVSPVELVGAAGRMESVLLERNRLARQPNGYLAAVGTGELETLEAGLVLRSVGYRGVALPDVPFDERRGVIPNAGGRVLSGPGGDVVPREYVAGWIKRGPTGIIGTNKACGAETAAAMAEDAAALSADEAGPARDPAAVEALLAGRCPDCVRLEDWRRLDRAETERGAELGRPRVKVVRVEEMLRIMGKRGGAG